jgi:hypothetical protein
MACATKVAFGLLNFNAGLATTSAPVVTLPIETCKSSRTASPPNLRWSNK